MGGYESSMNVFICGNIDSEDNKYLINSIFNEKEKKSKSKFESDLKYEVFSYYEKNNDIKLNWVGHIFSGLVNENFSKTLLENIKELYSKSDKEKEKDISRNNVILCFESNNEGNAILKELKEFESINSTEVVPIVVIFKAFMAGSANTDDYKRLKFVNFIPKFDNKKTDLRNIKSKLLTIDSYYNERGNIFEPIVYDNLNSISEKMSNTYITYLILGDARVGKSTFINLSAGQLVTKESSSAAPTTCDCTEYILPLRKTDRNNGYFGRIKLIDTPGLDKTDTVKKVRGKIKDYINDKKNLVNAALYFCRVPDFTDEKLKILRLLIENGIPVFFVITKSRRPETVSKSKAYKSIKTMIETNSKIKDISSKLLIKKQNSDEIENIVQINQVDDEDEDEHIFGIDNLYRKLINFFHYEAIKDCLSQMDSVDFDEQLSIIKNSNQIYQHYTLYSLLFRKINNLDDVLNGCKAKGVGAIVGITFLCGSAGLIPFPFADVPIVLGLEIGMIASISSSYEYSTNDFSIKETYFSGGKDMKFVSNKIKKESNLSSVGVIAGENAGKIAGAVAIEVIEGLAEEATEKALKVTAKITSEKLVSKSVKVASEALAVEVLGEIGTELALQATEVSLKKMIYTTSEKTAEFILEKGSSKIAEKIIEEGADVVIKQTTETFTKYASKTLSKKLLLEATESGAIALVKETSTELVQESIERVAIEITAEVIEKQGSKSIANEGTKSVPIIGTLIGMAIGFLLNSIDAGLLGKNVIQSCITQTKKDCKYLINLSKKYLNILEQMEIIAQNCHNWKREYYNFK